MWNRIGGVLARTGVSDAGATNLANTRNDPMGSTVTTRKLAAAFKSANGTVTFALFEESYSKNCYPRTPSWCCWSIGDIRHVMKAIFSAASSCEGGMLLDENKVSSFRRLETQKLRCDPARYDG